jgi:hypothetical protein
MTAVAEVTIEAAVERMLPVARRLTNAVRDRDQRRIEAVVTQAVAVPTPAGQDPLVVLAVALADELATTERVGASGTIRAERERCLGLAVSVARAPLGAIPDRARKLPSLIAQGVRP